MKEKIIVKIGGEEVEENYYKVTEDGKIYSLYSKSGKELKGRNSQGYVQVKLKMKNGAWKTFKRHRVVAEYFLADFSSDKIVEHENKIIDDDRAENLIFKYANMTADYELDSLKKRRIRLEEELKSVNKRIKELEK